VGVSVRKRHLAVSAALTFSFAALTQTTALAAGSVPGTPTNLATSPTPLTVGGTAQPCGTGTAYASADNIAGGEYAVLSATLRAGSDNAAGYSAAFWVSDMTAGTDLAPLHSAGQGVDGTPVSVDLPVTDGHTYSWTVNETDGTAWSPSAGPCVFTTDLTAPVSPTVASTDFPSQGGGLQSGEAGSFTLTSSDPAPAVGSASGLKGYVYSFDSELGVGGPVTKPNADGSLTISNQSFSWGTHTLYAQAVDNAGNVSGVTQYSFYVAQNPELSPVLRLQPNGPLSVLADGGGSTGLWPIVKCTYDFGDGATPDSETDCAASVVHFYAKVGTYPVTLTVTDKYGNEKSVTQDFTSPRLSKGTLFHAILNNSTWVSTWAEPTGSTDIAQAANTAMPDNSSQLVAVTASGALEHNIRNANGSWQGWRTLAQPGVTVTDASIAGMPNGSSQIIEITSDGVLKHNIRNANGSWQTSGWGTPIAGKLPFVQATITAMPDGSTRMLAVDTYGVLEQTIRHADGSWAGGWGQIAQTVKVDEAANASVAGMPNGEFQIIEVSAI
jgi:hypothetical protein